MELARNLRIDSVSRLRPTLARLARQACLANLISLTPLILIPTLAQAAEPAADRRETARRTTTPKEAAETIRQAVMSGRASLLAPLYQNESKVHLSLKAGPSRGLYGHGQVEVFVQQFLDQCHPLTIDSFDFDGGRDGAMLNIHVALTCRGGDRTARTKLHFSLEATPGGTGLGYRLDEVWESD